MKKEQFFTDLAEMLEVSITELITGETDDTDENKEKVEEFSNWKNNIIFNIE